MNLSLPFVGSIGYVGAPEAFPNFKRFGRHLKDHVVPHSRNNYHPHLLGHRAIALFSLLLLGVKIASITLITLGPIDTAYSSAITIDNVINLTNQSRVQNGLTELRANEKLRIAAQNKADDMLANQYFAHNTPDGRTPWDFIKASGYSYILAGENLAVDFVEAENVEDAWMNSPGHRANILNKDFEEIGIGIAQGQFEGHTSIFVVQMFGAQPEQQIQILAQPTKAEPAKAAPVLAQAPTPTKLTSTVASSNSSVESAQTQPEPTPVSTDSTALGSQNISPSPLIVRSDIPVTVTVTNGQVELLVWAPQASKVIADLGNKGIMLDPTSPQIWKARLPMGEIVQNGASITVEVYTAQGTLESVRVATFSRNVQDNYSAVPAIAGVTLSVLGKTFDVKALENKVYLVFITLILVSLLIAIAVHRHIQHISLVANGSFAAIFASLLWYFG